MSFKFAIHHKADNVGVAVKDIKAGELAAGVYIEDRSPGPSVKALEDIPLGHKIALRDIEEGESEYTLRGFADLVEVGGVSVLQPDAAKVGGLGKMVKIEGLAEALGAIVAPHSRPHSLWANILVTVHFVSTLPYESVVEIPPTPPVQEPLAAAVEFKDGAVKVPDVPGIGVKDDGWFGLYPPKEGEALDYHSR